MKFPLFSNAFEMEPFAVVRGRSSNDVLKVGIKVDMLKRSHAGV